MSTALLIAGAAAALACPLHMLWRVIRGRTASCAPTKNQARSLAARQCELAAQLSQAPERAVVNPRRPD